MVFILVPIPVDRGAHAPRVPFAAPSPQTVRSHASLMIAANLTSPFGEAPNGAREARALPNHLFWTWFIDNPRPRSAHLQ